MREQAQVPVFTDPCPICRGALGPWLLGVTDPHTLESFSVLRCATCGLGRTHPWSADLLRYYDESYYGGRHWKTDDYRTWRRCRMVARARPARGRLLDVGCGDGSFLRFAARDGWSAVGVEIGDSARAAAVSSGVEVVPTLADLPAGARFHAITLWHSLEHFQHLASSLSDLAGRLEEDGVLIIAVPDAGGFQARVFGASWFHLDVPRHHYHFTRSSLDRALGQAGVAVRHWRHRELEYDLFGWIQSALNRIMPTQNALFTSLTGKPHRAGRTEIVLSYALAALLAPAAVAATALSTMLSRGGTLIAVGRRVG